MKVASIRTPELARAKATATVPKRNLNKGQPKSDPKARKPKKYVKSAPKRFKLRPLKVDVPKSEYEDNWKSLKSTSKLQGLIVLLMITVQVIDIAFGKCRWVTITVNCFWLCTIVMAIASILTFLATKTIRFQSSTYIHTVISFQYFGLVAWVSSVFFVITIAISDDYKGGSPTQYERLLLMFSFMINCSVAIAAWFNSKTLYTLVGFEAADKIFSFKDRYGDIVFEIRDPNEEPPRPESPDDDPSKYDLV